MQKVFQVTQLRLALWFSAACLLGSCALTRPAVIREPQLALIRVSRPAYADDRDLESLVVALDQSIRYYDGRDANNEYIFGPYRITAQEQAASLRRVRQMLLERGLTPEFFDWLESEFEALRSASKRSIVTGYFEARLRGSKRQTDRFRYPLYRVPPDLVSIPLRSWLPKDRFPDVPDQLRARLSGKVLAPYWTREQIDWEDKLKGRGLEIAWIDDPLDVFFLHVQGSGIVELENGKKIRVNYSDKNGQPYRAIAALLIQQGYMTRESASMQLIRAFLKANPDKLREVLTHNPSYVFFRTVDEGPVGSIGVPLTPYRSIATDDVLFPRGALGLLESERPVFDEQGTVVRWERFKRLVVNQDTGGAIKGADKVDLFTGHGEQSDLVAGHMRQQGTLHFLVPRSASSLPSPSPSPSPNEKRD